MAAIAELLKQRILIIDGAMGTMIQAHKLPGGGLPRQASSPRHPASSRAATTSCRSRSRAIIEAIHRKYLEAGADIIETNTFNATSISLADYGPGGRGLRHQRGRGARRPPGRRRRDGPRSRARPASSPGATRAR